MFHNIPLIYIGLYDGEGVKAVWGIHLLCAAICPIRVIHFDPRKPFNASKMQS